MLSAPSGPIPISRPSLGEGEIERAATVLRSGQLAQGSVVAEFEAAFAEYIGTRYAVAVSSGTAALHLALLSHGIGPGDEVITTPFTFIATATAILHAGATPVFADIDPATLNLDPASVRSRISRHTRAIIAVHLYGNPCELGELMEIADRHGLPLIEDACQAHGATYGTRRVGGFGTGCFSFYPTKNMTSCEGGMITTSDRLVAGRCALLRTHGTRQRYLHEEVGFNYRMTDVHAAVGLEQLRRLDQFNQIRAANAEFYDAAIGLPRVSVLPAARSAWHQYTLIVDRDRRDQVVQYLTSRLVGSAVYYPRPVHRQPALGGLAGAVECPVADLAAAQVLSIPVHPSVTEEERRYVAAEVRNAACASTKQF